MQGKQKRFMSAELPEWNARATNGVSPPWGNALVAVYVFQLLNFA